MTRRMKITNTVLGLALVAAVGGAFAIVRAPAAAETTTERTATVTTGTVRSTITASGNIAASAQVGANFKGDGGTVTAIYVAAGDQVSKNQPLAKVDDTSARQTLASAEANLASAQAQLTTTTAGQTSAEAAQQNASLASAKVNLSNAQTSLKQAQQTLALDTQQQDAMVASAERDLQNATDPATRAQAKAALQQARHTRQSTLLRDRQQVQSAQGGVAGAQVQLQSTQAAAAVASQPATEGAVAQAQAQVAQAQVTVDQARQAVEDTTLRAPIAGTVTSISGVVGESSSSTSASGSTSSASTTSSSGSTAASGFVVIQGLRQLQVTAEVAEADAADVHVGQSATVTLSATNAATTGTVSAVALEDTVSNNVVQYSVTVTLNRPPRQVRLGQTTSVSIVTGVARQVLTVPSNAVTTVGRTSTVTVRTNGVNSTQTVVIGLVGDSATEVKSGLQEGQVVVIHDSSTSSSGFTFPGGGLPGGVGGGLG